jgi:hypothetical protein
MGSTHGPSGAAPGPPAAALYFGGRDGQAADAVVPTQLGLPEKVAVAAAVALVAVVVLAAVRGGVGAAGAGIVGLAAAALLGSVLVASKRQRRTWRVALNGDQLWWGIGDGWDGPVKTGDVAGVDGGILQLRRNGKSDWVGFVRLITPNPSVGRKAPLLLRPTLNKLSLAPHTHRVVLLWLPSHVFTAFVPHLRAWLPPTAVVSDPAQNLLRTQP